jgi:hypothetical protein
LIGYFILHAVFRLTLPEPGDIKEFEKKGKKAKYYTYYFSFTSLFHAVFGIICGKWS